MLSKKNIDTMRCVRKRGDYHAVLYKMGLPFTAANYQLIREVACGIKEREAFEIALIAFYEERIFSTSKKDREVSLRFKRAEVQGLAAARSAVHQ